MDDIKEELDASQWERFIKSIQYFNPYMYFTGGEPLLKGEILNVIKFASSLNLLTHLNTNGTLLAEKALGLVRVGLDYISCSLDCTGSISKDTTGRQKAYYDIVRGIKAIMAERRIAKGRFPIIQAFVTIHQKNQHLLFELAQLAEELGVDVFAISFPIFTTPELEARTRERFQKELGVEPKYWKGFIADMTGIDCDLIENQLDRIRSTKWRFAYRQFPPATKDFKVSTHFRNPEVIHGHRSCRLPWSLAVILPNGDVSTCWDHPDYIVGNILKQNFIDIWNGEKYQRFRQAIRKGLFPSCPRCTALYQ